MLKPVLDQTSPKILSLPPHSEGFRRLSGRGAGSGAGNAARFRQRVVTLIMHLLMVERSETLRQHETYLYTSKSNSDRPRGASGGSVRLIRDRDLAGTFSLAHFTLNFDKRHRWTAYLTQNRACWLRLQSPIISCLIWKATQKCPPLRSNDLTTPGTKDPITHHQDSWPSGLSDQRLPGAEGPPEEKKGCVALSLVPGDF